MSTFIATDLGPVSRLGPGVPGDAPIFRSLEFSDSLRLSYHCPALAVQGHSPAGETGAISRPSEPPYLGRVNRVSWNNRPQAACHQPSGCVALWRPLTRQQGGAATALRGGGESPTLILPLAASAARVCPSQAGETLFKGQRRVLKSPCEACEYVVFDALRVSKGFFTMSSKKTARRRHPSWGWASRPNGDRYSACAAWKSVLHCADASMLAGLCAAAGCRKRAD